MDWNLKNRERQIATALCVFFFTASSAIRYIALAQTPYPNGWDGYYYVMQAHSWINYGHLQSADFSLIYPYFITFSYLIKDYELAFKIGAAILSGGLVVSSFVFIHKVSKNIYAAVLAASFLLFSPTLTYITSQFPKNMMGMIVLIFFLLAIHNKNIKASVLLFLLSLFTHRMIAGLCLIGLALSVAQYVNWKWTAAGVATIIALSFLPGVIHFSDLNRFNGQFQLVPQLAPVSFFSVYKQSISTLWAVELIILSVLILVIIYHILRSKRIFNTALNHRLIWTLLLFLSIFPFFKISFGSMGYRFFMLAPLLFSLYFLCSVEIKREWAIALSFVFIACSAFSYRSYNPKFFDPPNKLYEIIVSRLEKQYSAKDYPLVIAHKSLAEMIIYKTDFDALNWVPPKKYDKQRILRIINGVDLIHFSRYMNENEMASIKKLTLHYYITSESNWTIFLKRVESNNDEQLIRIIEKGNNPMEERPYFLRKGKNL